MYKLACQYDKLQNNFAVEHFVDLKSACPDELKQIIIDDLQDITIVEACKLYVRGSIIVVVHVITKENVLQNNVHAKKRAFLVRQNVITRTL